MGRGGKFRGNVPKGKTARVGKEKEGGEEKGIGQGKGRSSHLQKPGSTTFQFVSCLRLLFHKIDVFGSYIASVMD
jgi:hypothetical protein